MKSEITGPVLNSTIRRKKGHFDFLHDEVWMFSSTSGRPLSAGRDWDCVWDHRVWELRKRKR